MTFLQREASRAQGQPITLYYFRYGSQPDAFYAYTDSETPVIVNGVAYLPLAIQRTSVTSSTLDKAKFTVTVAAATDIASLFLIYPPGHVVTLIIRNGHVGEKELPVVWTGRVIQCERNGIQAALSCESAIASMRRPGLRRNYQLCCPHVLYGPQCRADRKAATKKAQIEQVHFERLTLAAGWSGDIARKKYIGGMVQWESATGVEVRTITRITGADTLLLSGPTTGLKAKQNIDLVLGCNRQMGCGPQPHGDCAPLHDNILNFGGQAWIPTKNPIKTNPFN